MIKSEKIDLVSSALVKAQSEMGNASKSSANPFFKSKYADLNSIREAIMPALANHKLSIMQPMVVQDGKNYIETLIVHESGQYIGGITEVICAKVNDAQNFGAGTTYARRFGLQSLVCVGADDDDGNSASGKVEVRKESYPVKTSTNTTTGETTNILSNGKVETKVATPNKTDAAVAKMEEPKKGGFGVKKTEVKKDENGWD